MILILYILNIFINRWLNKIAYKREHCEITPQIWFVPLIPILVYLYVLILEDFFNKNNWFNGSNW